MNEEPNQTTATQPVTTSMISKIIGGLKKLALFLLVLLRKLLCWIVVILKKAWLLWVPLPLWKKVVSALLLAAPFTYFLFLKEPEPSYEFAIQEKTKQLPYDVYFVDALEYSGYEDNPLDRLRLSKGSIVKPFGVVVRLYNLIPQRAYQVLCEVRDADGQLLDPLQPYNIQSNNNLGNAYFGIVPDAKKHDSGDWTVRINVVGVGLIEKEFRVESLSREEKKVMADHEKAKQYAVEAFANFWVLVKHRGLDTFVTATEEYSDQDSSLRRYKLHQVADLRTSDTSSHIGVADKLNGISYRGKIGFGFTLYRSYEPNTGWTEWDSVGDDDNIFAYSWNRMTADSLANPKKTQQGPSMRYSVVCRDGNWFVTTNEKARFINGVRSDDSPDENGGRNSILSGICFLPVAKAVQEISDDGNSNRARLYNLAKDLKAKPDTVKDQQEETIEAVLAE